MSKSVYFYDPDLLLNQPALLRQSGMAEERREYKDGCPWRNWIAVTPPNTLTAPPKIMPLGERMLKVIKDSE